MKGYYSETDEEFYSIISKNLNELDGFPISIQEKKELWFKIYETAQRYEEQRQIDLKGTSERLGIALQGMYKSVVGLFSTIGESLPILERTVANMLDTKNKMQHISENIQLAKRKIQEISDNMQDTKENMHKTQEMIGKIKAKQKYLEERLKETKDGKGIDVDEVYNRVNDINSTVDNIIQGMKKQDS